MKKATIALLLICGAVFAQQKGSFTDTRDKKTYKTVKIGKQTWMAENLNYKLKDSKCYEDDESNCQKYGRLYYLNMALKACPKGWHLPNKTEWEAMTTYVGGTGTDGKKLKSSSGWNEDGNGTDEFGFSALPGGNGYLVDGFDYVGIGYSGRWWSANDGEDNGNYYYSMDYNIESTSLRSTYESELFSVRCLKN